MGKRNTRLQNLKHDLRNTLLKPLPNRDNHKTDITYKIIKMRILGANTKLATYLDRIYIEENKVSFSAPERLSLSG